MWDAQGIFFPDAADLAKVCISWQIPIRTAARGHFQSPDWATAIYPSLSSLRSARVSLVKLGTGIS